MLHITPMQAFTTETYYAQSDSAARREQTAHQVTMTAVLTLYQACATYEAKLGVTVRWTPGCAEWNKAETMTRTREYRKALDKLEGLVVAQIFELTKLNRAGTGKPAFPCIVVCANV